MSSDSDKDKRQGSQDEEDNAPSALPQAPTCSTATTSRSRRATLTFHPAQDDPVQLRAFLTGVCDRYARERENIVASASAAPHFESSTTGTSSRSAAQVDLLAANHLGLMFPVPSAPQNRHKALAGPTAAGRASAAEAGQPVRQGEDESPSMPPPAKRERRRRSTNQASLLRAKSIDFNAPDPEATSPPNETEDERRRRRERINGRRKRAKKMIEIDFLNEQYHVLREENTRLTDENKVFRERISMLKGFRRPPAGRPQAQVQRPIVARQPDQKAHAQDTATKTQASPSLAGQHPSLLQYALPPSAMAVRRIRGDTSFYANSPREESKESATHPQEPLHHNLAAAPLAAATRPDLGLGLGGAATHPWGGGFVDLSHSLQAAYLPQPPSIVSALFQHHAAAARPPTAAAGRGAATAAHPSSFSTPIQEIYQSLLTNQSQQLLVQQQQRQRQQQQQQQQQQQHQQRVQSGQPPSPQDPNQGQNQQQDQSPP